MAIGNGQVAITDVRILVIGADLDGQHVHVINHGTEPVYLGNGGVTAENGYRLSEEVVGLELNLGPGEAIWAVMASEETGSVSYIATMNE